jgi:hypothetical protein
MEEYVAPYVQVRHAIHLLYATSPRSRDASAQDDDSGEAGLSADRSPQVPTWGDWFTGEPDLGI